jgi:1,4-alpha-glucan branching enzyme
MSDRYPVLSADDIYLFNEGSHERLYEKLGAHPSVIDGKRGTLFRVWAPNAREVSVIGDFNGWNRNQTPLKPKASSGIWEGFVPGVGDGALYKYHVRSHHGGYQADKADPFGFWHEP